jgi:hypothetical protein
MVKSRVPLPSDSTDLRRAFQSAKQVFFDESSDVDHDATTNFVASEHVDHSTVSILSGTGLTGGGTIDANRTLALSHLGIEALTDPGADRILFWDDSATACKWLVPDGTTCAITDTTLSVVAGGVDHGSLGGLSDDDHTQYFLADGTRTITGPVTFKPGATHSFIFGDSNLPGGGSKQRMYFQGQTSGDMVFIDLFAKDGDGTDDIGFAIFAKGLPSNITNRELLEFRYDSGASEFAIDTISGGSGSQRNISIYTEGNNPQLYVASNGYVGIGESNPACELDVSGRLFINSGGNANFMVQGGPSTGRIAFECRTNESIAFLELYSFDGDGTDDMGFVVRAKGRPGSVATTEIIEMRYDSANVEFAIDTFHNGAGSNRNIELYTSGNRPQLHLGTDGRVGIATLSPSSALEVNGVITLGGNLDVKTYKIITTTTNGSIAIEPDGSGEVTTNTNLQGPGNSHYVHEFWGYFGRTSDNLVQIAGNASRGGTVYISDLAGSTYVSRNYTAGNAQVYVGPASLSAGQTVGFVCGDLQLSSVYNGANQFKCTATAGSNGNFVIIGVDTDGSTPRDKLQIINGASGAIHFTTYAGNVYIDGDNQYLYFGAGDDATISYDNTNLVINPKAAGSGLVNIDGDLDVDDVYFTGGSGGLQYGGISVEGNSNNTSVSNSGYTQFVHFDTDSPANGVTPSNSQDHLTVAKTGDYLVICSLSVLNSAGAGHVIDVDVKKNNGTADLTDIHAHRTLAAGTDVGSIVLSGIATLTANDTIEVWISSDSVGAKNITVQDCNLSITQIGG